MNTKLLEQSVEIFATLEKWNALFEVYELTNEIMKHWLAIGTKALIEEFGGHPSPGWKCGRWDHDHEVRWHLKEFGPESIGIGFGWNTWEFHLHIKGRGKDEQDRAAELLKTPSFQELLEVFGRQDNVPRRDGSLACDVTFNPYDGISAPEQRRRELAWEAAHGTGEFVKKMSSVIRNITDNPTFTAMFRELNRQVGCIALKAEPYPL